MRIRIPQIFDDTFGPLEALLAERTPAVQSHDGAQIFKLLTLFNGNLNETIYIFSYTKSLIEYYWIHVSYSKSFREVVIIHKQNAVYI